MIENINNSRKKYFIWLGVTGALFIVLVVLVQFAIQSIKTEIPEFSLGVLAVVIPYVMATLPLGWAVRRHIVKKYIHVPTEKIEVFETNLVLALGRILLVSFCVGVNISLLSVYSIMSVLIGIFFTPYFIVSGIVFIVQKKI